MNRVESRNLARKLAPLLWLAFMGAAAWVLTHRLRATDFGEILRQLASLPVSALVIATACSAGTYALVGIYEGMAVRLATGRRMRAYAFRTAVTANPIARSIGFAIVSGGALRYRMYAAQGLSLPRIGAVIVLVAMPYFFAVGWLIDLSVLLNIEQASAALRLPPALLVALGVAGLAKDIGWLVFLWLRKEPITLLKRSIPLPGPKHGLAQIAFGLAEISLMTTTLYVLMPPELGLSWLAFVAIYCLAFIAGQLSNVPAGLGVLEAALLLMLPHVPPAKLVGAVLAYRAVYEVLPLLVALVLLLVYEAAHPSGLVRGRANRP